MVKMRNFAGWQKRILVKDKPILNSLETATGDELKKIFSSLLEKVTLVGKINASIYLMHT